MILHVESEEAQKTVVFLNGKPVNHFIQAEDGENGWIEVIDAEAMAPLFGNEGDPFAEVDSTEENAEDWAPLKTKKIKGKVEFRHLG
jgi:hypothetical protein